MIKESRLLLYVWIYVRFLVSTKVHNINFKKRRNNLLYVYAYLCVCPFRDRLFLGSQKSTFIVSKIYSKKEVSSA